jgi:hypothetical protein
MMALATCALMPSPLPRDDDPGAQLTAHRGQARSNEWVAGVGTVDRQIEHGKVASAAFDLKFRSN